MNKREMYKTALDLAQYYHKGQVDKGGEDYIKHPLILSHRAKGENEKIVAILHDIIEDSECTKEILLKKGISPEIVDAVDAITQRKNENRRAYLSRVKKNPLAKNVKLLDLEHNSDISRIKNPTYKDYLRIERYHAEMFYLQEKS